MTSGPGLLVYGFVDVRFDILARVARSMVSANQR